MKYIKVDNKSLITTDSSAGYRMIYITVFCELREEGDFLVSF